MLSDRGDQPDPDVQRRLKEWFERSGWVQSPPDPRQRGKRKLTSKRGYEARLSAAPHEAPNLQRLLQRAGFQPGTPFEKAGRLVFPLYGKAQVQRFLHLAGGSGPRARLRSAGRAPARARSRSRSR